jgi:transcriptional regulator with XRE-family HTH domain
MPGHTDLSSPVEQQLLIQLGDRMKRARLSQHLTTVDLAKRLGMSRSTLHAAESGEPSATVGTYVRILGALGVVSDLALVAADAASPSSARAADDLVRLVLHQEAIRLLDSDLRLRARVLALLQTWKTSRTGLATRAGQWEQVVKRSAWSEVLAETAHRAELLQQSPLTIVVPASLRVAISTAVRSSGAKCLKQLDLVALQRAKAAAAIEELCSIGVVAEVIGSLAWGRWDARRSDVDILVLERGSASDGAVEAVAATFVGPRYDIVYLDQLRGPSRDFLLRQRREHGRSELMPASEDIAA